MTDSNEFTLLRDYGPPASPLPDAVLASARADLLAELSPAAAKPRRTRFGLRVAAAVAAALVIGAGVAVSRLDGGTTEVPQAGSSGPVRLVQFRHPPLPPELNPVPRGLLGEGAHEHHVGRGERGESRHAAPSSRRQSHADAARIPGFRSTRKRRTGRRSWPA